MWDARLKLMGIFLMFTKYIASTEARKTFSISKKKCESTRIFQGQCENEY